MKSQKESYETPDESRHICPRILRGGIRPDGVLDEGVPVTCRIIQGDCLQVMKTMDAESVDCCVTSPPYWGIRDYGVDGQIGIEEDPRAFIEKLVIVFREVRRVLHKRGTLWVVISDSYSSRTCSDGSDFKDAKKKKGHRRSGGLVKWLKPKDLVGIPWMLAAGLRDDGWWWRDVIIWYKPNPTPGAPLDRCTKTHDYILLFSKSRRYHFDREAVREPVSGGAHPRKSFSLPAGWDTTKGKGGHGTIHRFRRWDQRQSQSGVTPKSAPAGNGKIKANASYHAATGNLVTTRNIRSVWKVATQGYKEKHYAAYPERLIYPCIKAGCPEGGTVLDPFMGIGTTAVVALRLGKNVVGTELNPEYVAMAWKRIVNEFGLFLGQL